MQGFKHLLDLLAGLTLSLPKFGWIGWAYEFRVVNHLIVGRAVMQLTNSREVRWFMAAIEEVRVMAEGFGGEDFVLSELLSYVEREEVLEKCPELAL